MSHPHEEGADHESHHAKRPEWWNGISLGNVLGAIFTAFLVLIPFAVAWGANQEKNVAQDKDLVVVDEKYEQRVTSLEDNMKALTAKADDMAINQAVMRANIEMLVRAQGMRPVSPADVSTKP